MMKAFGKKQKNMDHFVNSNFKFKNEFHIDKKKQEKMPVLFKDAFMVTLS